MFLGLPDPSLFCSDPDLDPDPSINRQKSKEILDFYDFVTSFDFLSMITDVKVPSKSNKQ